jgi:DNA-binding transcriptional LysR family regulator
MESPDKPERDMPQLATLHAMGGRLKFKQLKLLIAIEDMGSVHQAALLLHMSQPGVSKALKEIEEAIGVTLFARTPQGLVPTDMGRCAIRYARLMLSSLSHMHEELLGMSRTSGARIAVGTIAGALAAVLGSALVAFHRAHPDVTVELQEGTSADLLEGLQSGVLDLALCRTSVARRTDIFEFEWLKEEEVAVAVSPMHALAGAQDVSWEQVAPYPWILFPGHMPLRTLLEREAASKGVVLGFRPVETASTFATALLLNQSPEMVALMSLETAQFFEASCTVSRLNLKVQSNAEPYGLVTRAGGVDSTVMAALKDCIRKQACCGS